jgi:hypothetical protein
MTSTSRATLGRTRCGVGLRRGRRNAFALRTRSSRWERSASSSWSALPMASSTSSETPRATPRSRRVYHSTLIPARSATSSRRSPGTRRLRPYIGTPARSGMTSGAVTTTHELGFALGVSVISAAAGASLAFAAQGISGFGNRVHGRCARCPHQGWPRIPPAASRTSGYRRPAVRALRFRATLRGWSFRSRKPLTGSRAGGAPWVGPNPFAPRILNGPPGGRLFVARSRGRQRGHARLTSYPPRSRPGFTRPDS